MRRPPHITIKIEDYEGLLSDLKKVPGNEGVDCIVSLIETEVREWEETEDVLASQDISRAQNLFDSIGSGFNRMRLLTFIEDWERKNKRGQGQIGGGFTLLR